MLPHNDWQFVSSKADGSFTAPIACSVSSPQFNEPRPMVVSAHRMAWQMGSGLRAGLTVQIHFGIGGGAVDFQLPAFTVCEILKCDLPDGVTIVAEKRYQRNGLKAR